MHKQVAAALAARHIGGAVNYVAVAEATGMTASAQAAGLAADNLVSTTYTSGLMAAHVHQLEHCVDHQFASFTVVHTSAPLRARADRKFCTALEERACAVQICAIYFTTVYWMARHISADSAPAAGSSAAAADADRGIQVLAAADKPVASQAVTARTNGVQLSAIYHDDTALSQLLA